MIMTIIFSLIKILFAQLSWDCGEIVVYKLIQMLLRHFEPFLQRFKSIFELLLALSINLLIRSLLAFWFKKILRGCQIKMGSNQYINCLCWRILECLLLPIIEVLERISSGYQIDTCLCHIQAQQHLRFYRKILRGNERLIAQQYPKIEV